MKLLLVESPAKCKKIESFLDPSYKVEATYGHLRYFDSLNDISNDYNIKFKNMQQRYSHISKLKKLIDISNEVILATDNDREGEAIAWHVIQMFALPENSKRILFNEITKDAILSALNNATIVNQNLVQSQQTRQILDIFVGYKISPHLWNTISRNNNLSAGRCQTPALNIIYENYITNKNKVSEEVYNVIGYFTSKNIEFKLNQSLKSNDTVIKFLKDCKSQIFSMTSDPNKRVTSSPPKPFITSSIQQTCNNAFHISPKETMLICQKLYESGVITYMRTDSYYLSDEFCNSSNEYICSKYNEKYWNNDVKKGSKQAHEAIRPTNVNRISLDDSYSPKEKKIYLLIWKRTLQSLMSQSILDEKKYIIPYNETLKFTHTTELCIFDGWKVLDKNNAIDNYREYLESIHHENIHMKKMIAKGSFTNQPHHLSESLLVKELETKGIGRPSTFCSLVEKIKERKYVERKNIDGRKQKVSTYELCDNKIKHITKDEVVGSEKNKLVITSLGIMVIENLITNFNELFDYDFTSKMEEQCDHIANGEMEKMDVCESYKTTINSLVKSVDSKSKIKYMIDDTHEYIIGKNGPVIKCTSGEKTIFKKIKPNIELEKIKNNEYTLDEIIEENEDKNLGCHREMDVVLKRGQYGIYLEYDNRKISLKSIDKVYDDISIVDVIDLLDSNDSNVLREFSNNLNIRNGKYGHFIYHKTDKMKKPQFISLKDFKGDYMTCDETEIEVYILEQKEKPKKKFVNYKKFK
jgi:DNA topoisomerase-1